MGLRPHKDDTVEVMDVDMNEHPEKSTEYLLADLEKVLWKGNTYTCRKYILIVDLHFDPVHEKIHILGRWQCCGLLVLQVILPPVLILRPSRHHWAGPLCAELTNSSINEVDPIEEVNNMNSHPVILVFSTGQLHSCFQVHA